MTYAGWNPAYRAFQQSDYVAVGGETTIPNKGAPESLLVKDGKILLKNVDYVLDIPTGNYTLFAPAEVGAVFQVLNLSTYHVSDTYTKAEFEAKITLQFVTATAAQPAILPPDAMAVAMDCTAGSAHAVLPLSPMKGMILHFYDPKGSITPLKKFTVKRNNIESTIMGLTEDLEVTVPKISFNMSWDGSDWRVF